MPTIRVEDIISVEEPEPIRLDDIAEVVEAPEAPTAPRQAGALDRVEDARGDTVIDLLRGLVSVPQSILGLADIPTGGRVGKFLEDTTGLNFSRMRDALAQGYSPARQQGQQAVSDADGFVGTAKALLQHPSVIAGSVVESAPPMVAGGIIGRAATLLPKVSPLIGAAVGEGAITAGQAAEDARAASPTGRLTPTQSAIATASGAATGGLGLLGARLAKHFGVVDIETLIAGAQRDPVARRALVQQIVLGAVQEGGLEEFPQSLQEQIAQNMMTGRSPFENIDEAGVLGAVTGGVMGAGGQLVDLGRARVAQPSRVPAPAAVPAAAAVGVQAPPTPPAPAPITIPPPEMVAPPVEPAPADLPISEPAPPTVADVVEIVNEPEAGLSTSEPPIINEPEGATPPPGPPVNASGEVIEPTVTDPPVLPPGETGEAPVARTSPEEIAYNRIREAMADPTIQLGSRAARELLEQKQALQDTREAAAAERGEVDTRDVAPALDETAPVSDPLAEAPQTPVTVADVAEVIDAPAESVENPEAQPFRVKRLESLTGEDARVQERAAAAVEADPNGMVAKYLKRFKTVLNADNASELFPDYARSAQARSWFVRAVRPAAAAVVERAYRHLLARPPAKGKAKVVVFTGGGNGSGKSSTLGASELKRAAVVMDSTLSDFDASKRNIEQALAAGFDVRLAFVHRDPIEALKAGTLPRAMQEGAGRTVPIAVHARTHIEAPKVLRRLAEAFADDPRVQVDVFANRESGGLQPISLSELKEGAYADRDVLVRDLVAAADAEYAAGRISEAVYRGTVGRAPERDAGGARRDSPGDARQLQGEHRAPAGGAVGDGERTNPVVRDRQARPAVDEPGRVAEGRGEDGARRRRRDASRRARERKAVERQDRLDTLQRLIDKAVADGFTGDPEALRAELNNRLQALQDITDAVAESGTSPARLISEIRRLGGVSIAKETAYKGELRWLKQHFGGQGTQSMSGVVRTGGADGLSLDDMLTHLRQDPAFAHIRRMDDLIDELRAIATTPKDVQMLHERLAKGLGERWWENLQPTPDAAETLSQVESEAAEPVGDDADISFDVSEFEGEAVGEQPTMPVDILDTGEAQARLPGAEEARHVGKADTSFRAPVQASGDDFSLSMGGPEPEAPKGPSLFDEPAPGGGGSEAMAGLFTTTLDPMPATVQTLQPIEFPELVDLARELLNTPQVVKRFRNPGTQGMFTHLDAPVGAGRIRLAASLFQRTEAFTVDTPVGARVIDSKTGKKLTVTAAGATPTLQPDGGGAVVAIDARDFARYRVDVSAERLKQLTGTLAHEIGHLVDWLPDYTLKRGNLLGRLFTLKKFLGSTFVGSDGQTIENADIRRELLDLSKKWRPWDPETSSASFNRYRKSGKELYADALSALLNNPGLVQQDAPIFFEQFFNELDKKPDVRQAYFGLQELLAGTPEEVIRRRRAGVRGMFAEGDMKAMDLERLRQAERAEARKGWWQKFRIQHIDKNTAIRDRVDDLRKRGVTLNPDDDPRYMLEERNYLGGFLKGFAQQHIEPLYRDIVEGGIGWTTFGEALFYERVIAGDRSEVANPRGITPDVAETLYADLKAGLDPEQQRELGEAVDRFRTMVRTVAEQAYEAGLYSDELYAQMQENPAYAAYRVIDHLDKDVTSTVYRQIGTLKDITNPADATILKALVTLRAIEHQRVKVSVFDFLHTHFPQDIQQADERWNGRGRTPVESRDKKQVLITYKEKGRLRGKYVPELIATSLNNESIGSNWTAVTALRWVNGTVFRPLFTTMNAGFQTFNAARDFVRFWKNQPDMTFGRAMQLYAKAVPLARVRAFGMPSASSVKYDKAKADLVAAEEARILGVTYNDMVHGREVEDTQIEDILSKLDIGEFGRKKPTHPVLRQARDILDYIAKVGDFLETLPKAAGIYEYAGDGAIADIPADQRSIIRRRLGSPDFLAGGTFKPITNELLLFSNAITQAIRTDVEVATDPTTRAAFWWKTAKVNIAPKLALFAAVYLAGSPDEEDDSWFADVRRALRGITEYDLTNYLVLPLGKDETGNTVYVRIPQDDAGRLIGGLTWKLLRFAAGDRETVESAMQVFDYMTGQAPTVTPVLEAVGDIVAFSSGNNVYDSFRSRMLFTEDELRARDWRTVKKFVGYEFQQMGGSAIWKFVPGEQRPRSLTPGQEILELPIVSNIAGRWIRVTNYGEVERLREAAKQTARTEAQRRLTVREAVNDALTAFERAPAAERTPEKIRAKAAEIGAQTGTETVDVLRRLNMGLARQGSDALTDAVLSAGSNAQKIAVITRAAAGMSDATLRGWLIEARRQRIVSSEVAAGVREALGR